MSGIKYVIFKINIAGGLLLWLSLLQYKQTIQQSAAAPAYTEYI